MLRTPALGALAAAEVVSSLGSRMTYLALPWFVLVTTGSATRMGAVLAAELAPVALLGVPSGGVVARLGARRSMLVCDLARAPLVAAVPALHAAGVLSFPALLALVTLVGCFHAPSFASQRVVLPELVGEDEQRIAQANALVEGGNQLTALVGPAAAGVLIAWIGVTNVVYVDAATYLVSFALVKLCVPERPPLPTSEASGVLAGLRHLLGDRLLGPLLATALVANLAGPALTASLSALAFEQYGRSSRVAGLFFAAIGGGALLGVGAAMGLLRAVAPIRLAAAAFALGALSLWALPFALPAGALAVALAWFGAATPLVNAPLLGLVTARTPEALRAKVMLAVITVAMLAGPLGALAAGPLIETVGVRFVLALVAGVMTLASLAFATIAWARGEAGVAAPRSSAVGTP